MSPCFLTTQEVSVYPCQCGRYVLLPTSSSCNQTLYFMCGAESLLLPLIRGFLLLLRHLFLATEHDTKVIVVPLPVAFE
jgi:hypothetical protein